MLREIFLLILFTALLSAEVQSASLSDEVGVRIGIVAYEDSASDLEYFQKLRTALRAGVNPPPQIQFAIGTYADILHWIKNDYIDLALVTPGIFSELLANRSRPKFANWEYLASEVRSLHSENLYYHSVCVVNSSSWIKSVEDLKRDSSSIEFLGVDPLSVSGFLVPRQSLKVPGIDLASISWRFTNSHSISLQLLLESSERARLACVWDGALEQFKEKSKLRIVSIPGIDQVQTPPNALIGRSNSKQVKALLQQILRLRPKDFRLERSVEASYLDLSELFSGSDQLLQQKVSLHQISDELVNYARSSPIPPRLAVVFAGGGAKCSFQTGAIRAVEEELLRASDTFKLPDLGINLVVGTSGGAINAMAVALGLSSDTEGQQHFVGAWKDLDRREIISPAPLVRLNMSVWLASLEILVLILIGSLIKNKRHPSRQGVPVIACLFFGALQLYLSFNPGRPWGYLGTNGVIHTIWLWFTYGFMGAGLTLLTLGVLTLLSRLLSEVTFLRIVPSRRSTVLILLFIAVGLPALQTWRMLLVEQTFSRSDGIEQAFIRNFSELLIYSCGKKEGCVEKLTDQGTSAAERLRKMGEALKQAGLLKRDLVLTASPLTEIGLEIPADLYFYAPSGKGSSYIPEFGKRGYSLDQRADLTFDVLIGSGAIYPLFPARTLVDFPAPGKRVQIVDGSFAHRSPIEAAQLWGATHIIQIEAATEELTPRGNLLSNVAAALAYLYDQAQLTDVRSRGEVPIYTLVPQPPHIGIMDFSDNLISMGIEKGYNEAKGVFGQATGVPAFRKELGMPLFW